MTNKAGRPKLELDEEQVFKLASLNMAVKDMADVLGCSKSALENNYLDVINRGRANMRTSMLRKQYEVGITDKNVTGLVRSIRYVAGLVSEDHVALGSEFDGAMCKCPSLLLIWHN